MSVGIVLKDDTVIGTLTSVSFDLGLERWLIKALLHNRDDGQTILVCDHGQSLLQDFLCDRGTVKENTPAVALLDRLHIAVLQDSHRGRLLGQILDGTACNREVSFGSLATMHASDDAGSLELVGEIE